MLGVHFDHKLTFETHIKTLCKKSGQKRNGLARIILYKVKQSPKATNDL